MTIELQGTRWITGTEGARMAGIHPDALRARRHRENGGRHPRSIRLGSVVLYDEREFRAYLASWIDGRGR